MDGRTSARIVRSTLTPEMKQVLGKIKPTTQDQINGRINYWCKTIAKFFEDFRRTGGVLTDELERVRDELRIDFLRGPGSLEELKKTLKNSENDAVFVEGAKEAIASLNAAALKNPARFYTPPTPEEVRQRVEAEAVKQFEMRGLGLPASRHKTGEVAEVKITPGTAPYRSLNYKAEIFDDETGDILKVYEYEPERNPGCLRVGNKVAYVRSKGYAGEAIAVNIRNHRELGGRTTPGGR